ncbi:hypothetical protein TNCV_4021501 [Trichonephila clavipes]|nr:hypothetical protein TNCV_4021501 [Trichonephila clavipes]
MAEKNMGILSSPPRHLSRFFSSSSSPFEQKGRETPSFLKTFVAMATPSLSDERLGGWGGTTFFPPSRKHVGWRRGNF